MNVTEGQFRTYLEVFHATLETAAAILPSSEAKNIRHISYLPARIVGYISTQFGVAFEYIPAEQMSIEINRGSARIEDLFLQQPRTLKNVGITFSIAGQANFFHCVTRDSIPFHLTHSAARILLIDFICSIGTWMRSVAMRSRFLMAVSDHCRKSRSPRSRFPLTPRWQSGAELARANGGAALKSSYSRKKVSFVTNVSPKILSLLAPETAVDLFRELLWAEAHRAGIGPALVSVPGAINVADGGVDAEITGAGLRICQALFRR
jgi:hypothetical protein